MDLLGAMVRLIADAFPRRLKRMSEEHGETVKMVKLDIDEEPELAEKV